MLPVAGEASRVSSRSPRAIRDSNAQRIIAYAKLERTEPLAAAEGAGLSG